MASQIDLNKVKNLTGILNGEKPPLTSSRAQRLANFRAGIKDPLRLNIVIVSYRGKYHKFAQEKHEKLREAEVVSYLEGMNENDFKLYYVCTEKEMSCPVPQAFLGKKSEVKILKDTEEVIDFIASETNVQLSKSDL